MHPVNELEQSIDNAFFRVGYLHARRKDLNEESESELPQSEVEADNNEVKVEIQFSSQSHSIRVEMQVVATSEFADLEVLVASSWKIPEDRPEVESYEIEVLQDFARDIAFPRTYTVAVSHLGDLARSIEVPVPGLNFDLDRHLRATKLTLDETTLDS